MTTPAPEAIEAAARAIDAAEDLEALADNSVIRDKSGDVGIIFNGKIWYPETAPLNLHTAKRYLPAIVLYEPSQEATR